MAELTVLPITPDGLDTGANLVAADAAGDDVANAGGLLFVVDNADAGPHTVTVSAPVAEAVAGNYGVQAVADIVISVPASERREFVIPSGYAADNKFSLAYDDVTSVSVGVFSLGFEA